MGRPFILQTQYIVFIYYLCYNITTLKTEKR
jgi:hypothetical protein